MTATPWPCSPGSPETATDTPAGFITKPFDGDVGLQYNWQRWYDPQLGRFVSASPLSLMSEHPYGYGFNNPMTATDANGLWSLWNPFTWGDPNPVGQGLGYSLNPFSDANRDLFPALGHQTVVTGMGLWNSIPIVPNFSYDCLDNLDIWSMAGGEISGAILQLALLLRASGWRADAPHHGLGPHDHFRWGRGMGPRVPNWGARGARWNGWGDWLAEGGGWQWPWR